MACIRCSLLSSPLSLSVVGMRSFWLMNFSDENRNDRMFGAIGMAVLSGLGRRYTQPGRWIHLPFRGH